MEKVLDDLKTAVPDGLFPEFQLKQVVGNFQEERGMLLSYQDSSANIFQ